MAGAEIWSRQWSGQGEMSTCKLTDLSVVVVPIHIQESGDPVSRILVKRPMCSHPQRLCNTTCHSEDPALAAYHGAGSDLVKWKRIIATQLGVPCSFRFPIFLIWQSCNTRLSNPCHYSPDMIPCGGDSWNIRQHINLRSCPILSIGSITLETMRWSWCPCRIRSRLSAVVRLAALSVTRFCMARHFTRCTCPARIHSAKGNIA